MRILHVNAIGSGGGPPRAAYRLCEALANEGVDANLLVAQKNQDFPLQIERVPQRTTLQSRLILQLEKLPRSLYPNRKLVTWSNNWVSNRLVEQINQYKADIVHLHWIGHGFLPVTALRQIESPIVWTFHDMWALTGGCHYDEECGRYQESCGCCPQLGSDKENDLSRWNHKRKVAQWGDIDVTVVALSQWLAECTRSSSLWRNKRIELIPYGLDLSLYRPQNRVVARRKFNLPADKRIILFGAINSTGDPRKGFQFLQPTFRAIRDNPIAKKTELAVFGASQPSSPPDLGLPAHYLGNIKNENDLAMVYSAADVVVTPSMQDNLPSVVMESLACGTPCVAFNIGGMPDMIEHQKNGFLAQPFDTDELARGILWVLEDPERWQNLAKAARTKAESEFELGKSAKRMAALYSDILEQAKQTQIAH